MRRQGLNEVADALVALEAPDELHVVRAADPDVHVYFGPVSANRFRRDAFGDIQSFEAQDERLSSPAGSLLNLSIVFIRWPWHSVLWLARRYTLPTFGDRYSDGP